LEKFVLESMEWLEKMRDKVHQSLEEYMTTVRDELGAPPDRPAVEALYLAQCARVLDADVVSREWTAESTAVTDIEGALRGDANPVYLGFKLDFYGG
jgi:lipoate-protein ligase A